MLSLIKKEVIFMLLFWEVIQCQNIYGIFVRDYRSRHCIVILIMSRKCLIGIYPGVYNSIALYVKFTMKNFVLIGVVQPDRIHPSYAEVYVGDNLRITCYSVLKNNYIPTTWTFNNSRLFGLPYYQGPQYIVIESVQLNNAGTYSCFGLEKQEARVKKRYTYFIATSTIKVYGEFILCTGRQY